MVNGIMQSPTAYVLVNSKQSRRSSFSLRCSQITTALRAIFFMNAKILPTDVNSNNNSESVLYRKSNTVCLLSWIICLSYTIVITLQSYAAPRTVCNIVPHDYGSFHSFACATAVSGFFFTFLMLSVRIFQAGPGNERVPSIIALNIISVGLLSTLSFVIFNFNGVCIDSFGVATPAIMWSEWLSNGPTIVFLTLALTEKKDLSNTDLAIIMSFFVCMVSGFLLIIPQPRYLAYFWLSVCAVSCLPVLYLPWYVSLNESAPDIEEGGSNHPIIPSGSKKHKQQFYLALWTTIVCPLFPLNYALAATKIIGPGESTGIFLLLTLLLKAFFAASLADAHTNVLLDAQKDLDRERQANEARRAFLKYLFHEVRTPLNSLTMGIELLKTREALEVADLELLAMMTGAVDFMSETLNNILSMQKIEEGKMELTFAPFSISRSITKIFSALSGAVMAKNLNVERIIAADVPALLVGDLYRVEHVISNLLSNAIKFSPDGGVIRLNVTATAATTTQDSESLPSTIVMVAITDEGPGISAENQVKLFSGFFQVRPDQLQQGKGSGLGLALCKQIVSLHGGTIGVDSAEGQGSTFHFCIPFGVPNVVMNESQGSNKQEEASKHEEEEVELPPIPATFANIRASTITVRSNLSLYESAGTTDDSEYAPGVLVVDDVASNRKMLQALLKKNGAKKVDTAENGLEAVHAAQANPLKYDIIFMDNFMPVMCGVEAVRKLREEGYAKLVVGVTGNILDDDVMEYLSAGADMVLGKPVKVDMLRMLIRHVKVNGNLSIKDLTLSEGDGGFLVWTKK